MAKKTAVPAAAPAEAGERKIGSGTDIDSIRLLVQLMVDNDLSEVDITDGEVKVHLKRGPSVVSLPHMPVAGHVVTAPQLTPSLAAAASAAHVEPPKPPAETLLEIKSPMVGTFYSAPSPDSDPYVTVGSAVGDDTVVCIIEAMKVMNEIRAECVGKIVEVCVQNAQPVEYGQVLFRVRPS
ncbi:MAG: Biotin carboxyl carrier protein of acetyl-CoA carboxylase [Planctomycetes bacterium ADurb.Bin126]|nr:MAG: Biotin carboxyl carrier protein of acetyl-CoA carboxylase [Planctomycetes bacterium ADurb.Bin126]HOD84826.1 acetyl-CoA carboxylase biotin carboxyl carrier protein [Phycisphaerae bacterium]HQL75433.1 acetyl-CoA carboxylase biotin carboxyl carrier protein [Phycisphaerae bacterium]